MTTFLTVLAALNVSNTSLPVIPALYKDEPANPASVNPFNFGQQNQPVQDTTALANLLRTA